MATKTRSRGKQVKDLTTPADESKRSTPNLNTLVMLSQQLLSVGRFNKDLPSFIFRGVDSEQLWQQLELRNNHQLSLSACTREVVQISKRKRIKREKKNDQVKPIHTTEHEAESDSGSDSDVDNALDAIKTRLAQKSEDEDDMDLALPGDEGDDDDDDDDDDNDDDNDDLLDFDFKLNKENPQRLLPKSDEKDDEERKEKKTKSKPSFKKSSVVDDQFFKMAEMENFLDTEDQKEEKRLDRESNKNSSSAFHSSDEEDEEIDFFASGSDSDDEKEGVLAKYTDFFDPPDEDKTDKVKNAKKASGSDGNNKENENDDSSDDEKIKEEEGSSNEEDDSEEDKSDIDEEKPENMEVDSHEDEKDLDAVDDLHTKDSKKKVSFSKDLFHSDDGEKPDVKELNKQDHKSTFEQKQEKLRTKVREMEELSLQEPSWELTGEVMSSKRPENSLLETVMDFQHTARAAPIITDDTTKSLEDYVRMRIKDKTFDDVERKEKPKEDVFEFKKRIVLDQEKSKQSLAEIYEQEFIKQQKTDAEEVKTDPLCENIEKELNSLFYQLDALSNFRYTPMKPGTEVKIVVNTPAITLEEVAPVATTDADLLAPEEVMAKRKGDLKASGERDETDKKRARRQKKMEKREKKKAKEAREKKVDKLKPGLGNKYSKIKALQKLEEMSKLDKSVSLIKDDGKRLKSSSSFFAQLQDEVTTNVKAAKAAKAAKKEKKKKMDAGALIL